MYPTLGNPTFQTDLLDKPEFAELETAEVKVRTLDELKAQRGKSCSAHDWRLGSHQLFLRRFLGTGTPYRSALFYHGTGVGKSCSAIQVAEEFLSQPSNEEKKVLVLSSDSVRLELEQTVFSMSRVGTEAPYTSNQCTGTTYLRKLERMRRSVLALGNSADRVRMEAQIRRLMENYYEFWPYLAWANRVLRKRDELDDEPFEDWVRETFSDRLLIVDEAHNSRPSQGGSEKRVETALRWVVKYSQNLTLILLSATPMYNDYTEIVWLLNLCVWNDKREDLFRSWKLYDVGFKADTFFTGDGSLRDGEAGSLFRSLVRSYVSYVRGDNPFQYPFRLLPPNPMTDYPTTSLWGEPLKPSERLRYLPLVGVPMSEEQAPYFNKVKPVSDLGDDEEVLDQVEEEAFEEPAMMTRLMGFGNIVFPGGRWDTALEYRGGKVRYAPGAEGFLRKEELGKWAPKMKGILECIEKGEGLSFVYSNFKTGGVLPFALALEEAGYVPYGRTEGFLEKEKTGPPKGTYILLTGVHRLNPKGGDMERELAVARSPANRDGKLIRVILGTKRVMEGVSFSFVRQMHVLEPWFNMSLIDQVVGRSMRSCSHSLLPFEKQNTTLYLWALTNKDKKTETVDTMAYRISETKARAIQKIVRVLQESAFDCWIEWGKNHYAVDLNIPQTRSEDGANLTLNVNTVLQPLITESLADSCEVERGSHSELSGIPKPSLPFVKDRESEIWTEIGRLFERQLSWEEDELGDVPSLKPYSSAAIQYVLEQALLFPARYRLIDSRKRVGHLVRWGKVLSWEAERREKPQTTEDRTLTKPRQVVVVEAPKLDMTPPEGDWEPAEIKKVIGTRVGDPVRQFEVWKEDHRTRLTALGVAQSIVDAVLLEQAFDTARATLRWDLFQTLVQHPEEAGDLKPLLDAREVQGAWIIVHPQGKVQAFEAGGKEVSVPDDYVRTLRKEYIETPSNTLVACTEYDEISQTAKQKLQMGVKDARAHECMTFKKEQLRVLFTRLGYGAKVAASQCLGLDAYLRAGAGNGVPEGAGIRYYNVEQRQLLKTLRKVDFRGMGE